MVSKRIYSSSKMPECQRNRPLVNLQNSDAYDTKNNQIFQRAVQILKYIMTNAPKNSLPYNKIITD